MAVGICAAREKDPGDLNSGMLVEGMKAHGVNAVWMPTFDDTEAYLRAHLAPGDLAITMGCGDVCPVFPGKRYLDWTLDDPAGQGVGAVRPIRDEIRRCVLELLGELGVEPV